MRRSENKQGRVLLVFGTEREIYPIDKGEGMRERQGKDEIIVEMSEMCLRAPPPILCAILSSHHHL